jgi:hypothetical protein
MLAFLMVARLFRRNQYRKYNKPIKRILARAAKTAYLKRYTQQ